VRFLDFLIFCFQKFFWKLCKKISCMYVDLVAILWFFKISPKHLATILAFLTKIIAIYISPQNDHYMYQLYFKKYANFFRRKIWKSRNFFLIIT
jgi:hypothetical protein